MVGSRFLVLAVVLAWAAPARGQAGPVVTPPVVQGSTEVPYPPGAQGDAVVVLEIVVDGAGRVSAATVVEGHAPFAEQARRAVLGWRFVPARRGYTAVAARLRARVEFHSEQGPEAPAAAQAGPVAKATPVEPPEEVIVRGRRREIGETTLSAADVQQMPGAFGEPFRAVEALPGVTPALSGVPYFFVRGAPPNDSGYFLDGVRVPLLFHVGLGPGVVHPGLLERIDVYPSAAPARFGGFAGAIVAGRTRRPAPVPHGQASVRLVDAGALVETPFAEGRASALVAGRYGYPGPVVGALSDVRLGYWDYQSRVAWRFGAADTLSLLAFGSHDYLGHRSDTGSTVEDLVSDFHRVDLRHDHAWARGHARIAGTLGYDRQGSDPTYLRNRSAALRLELEQQLSTAMRLRAGAEARLDVYDLEVGVPAEAGTEVVPSNVQPTPTNLTTSLHADIVWRALPRLEVVPGARLGVFHGMRARAADDPRRTHTAVPAADPRLSTRTVLGPGAAWLSSFGLSHQYPALRVGALPGLIATGSGFPAGSSRLQRSLALSQGVELDLPAETTLRATAFLAHFTGLTDLTAGCLRIEPPTAPIGEGPSPLGPYHCPNNEPVDGHAHGIELLVRRPLSKRLGGLFSYTLSRSVRDSRFLTLDGSTRSATVPGEFDRTHVLNLIVSYALGRRWRAGTRVVFYSGAPYSTLAGNVPVPPYNNRRDPPFFRLDIRLEKRWRLGQEQSIGLVVEGQNVTLSREPNTLGLDCRGDITPNGQLTTHCERGTVGPITIPSVGVDAIF